MLDDLNDYSGLILRYIKVSSLNGFDRKANIKNLNKQVDTHFCKVCLVITWLIFNFVTKCIIKIVQNNIF